jgi:7-cyano-7-deazaguanine synthase
LKAQEKHVVLLSGGIDSTVLLHQLAHEGYLIYSVAFHYGQRHSRELACARSQAKAVGVADFRCLDMSFLSGLLGDASALIPSGMSVPELADIPMDQRDHPPTYVPNRNLLFLSVAAAYAEAIGASWVCYGAQAADEYGYWDCTPLFLERVNQTLSLNRHHPITVKAPLINNSKTDNVRLGLELGVDFGATWSCYRGDEYPCGVCPTCVERLHAFKNVGVDDPLSYKPA